MRVHWFGAYYYYYYYFFPHFGLCALYVVFAIASQSRVDVPPSPRLPLGDAGVVL